MIANDFELLLMFISASMIKDVLAQALALRVRNETQDDHPAQIEELKIYSNVSMTTGDATGIVMV